MRQIIGFVIFVMVLAALATSTIATDKHGVTADEALQKLMAGNKRFVEVQTTNYSAAIKDLREELTQGQNPYAVIVACSDSRVPPEIVFDETLGRLFVIRVAGNVIDPVVLGSIEYAVEHLNTPLILVLGHESCGAVTAAFHSSGKAEGNIEAVIRPIMPAVQKAKDTMKGKKPEDQVDAAIDSNIDFMARDMIVRSPIIKDHFNKEKLKIVKGKYHLRNGEVTIVR